MDNDLMARRLRPSQPTPQNGQSQPPPPPSPWDVPLTDDGGSFAPADSQRPQNDPPFEPPHPASRADVPWDRPAPEAWPPSEDAGTDHTQTWSAQGVQPTANENRPDGPAADAIGEATPWDRPTNDQSLDPDDAMAPVVGDVHAPAGVWHEWSGNGTADGYAANGNGNGNGHSNAAFNGAGYGAGAKGGGGGIRYAPENTPEPMTITAHSDQPRSGDEPRPASRVDAATPGGNGPSLPSWPAEDDLTPPSSSRDLVMPEDSWPVAPSDAAPPASPAPWERAEVADAPEPAPAPERPPVMPAAPAAPPQPVAPPASVTPIVTSAQIVPSPAGSPQNMVLRIELAIVDESHRANPADAAKRVGPDAGVRAPEYNPRIHGGRAPMPEPEYEWGAPRNAQDPRRQRNDEQPATQPRHVAPPPNSWQPAPAQPTQLDWDLPQVGGPQADQPAPWSTPNQPQPRQGQAPPHQLQGQLAPAPTWAMTEPQPPYQPAPPQYMPPPAQRYQQPPQPQYSTQNQQTYPQGQQSAWPPAHSPDPLYGVPAAPNQQPADQSAYPQPSAYQPTPYSQPAPPVPVPSHYPAQSVPSAPAAGSRARTGQANAAADQADLWFLSNQSSAGVAAFEEEVQERRSSSLLTGVLTVGFALLVIVLVLVFIQLMTSLLK
ncbi:MAG TPA: hypothetical protein VM284_01165 [Candidatus Limnocylindria bacterium]|nr:hypothetical protein [Candidatus Limnocylindria bacterium]